MNIMELEELIGTKIIDVNICEYGNTENSTEEDEEDLVDLLVIKTNKGNMFFYYWWDCGNNVHLEDGFEDLRKMIGEQILQAEVVVNRESEPLYEWDESYTWTYYKISSLNHDCTLRFYGSSNGCYSESVNIRWEEK